MIRAGKWLRAACSFVFYAKLLLSYPYSAHRYTFTYANEHILSNYAYTFEQKLTIYTPTNEHKIYNYTYTIKH